MNNFSNTHSIKCPSCKSLLNFSVGVICGNCFLHICVFKNPVEIRLLNSGYKIYWTNISVKIKINQIELEFAPRHLNLPELHKTNDIQSYFDLLYQEILHLKNNEHLS